jgi:hypothetical protein
MRTAALLAAAAAAAAALPAAHAAQVPKLAGCIPGATPTVRPKEIIVACGDANFYFTNLKWASWNAARATAGGIAHLNDCKPYCAAGHFHTYRIAVTLSRPQSCKSGNREFTHMAWRFTVTRPAGQARSAGQPLPCR